MCFEEESTQEEAVEPVEEDTRQMSDRLDCQIRLQGESLERDWLCDTEGKTSLGSRLKEEFHQKWCKWQTVNYS